jgi:hypothetical protein
MGLAPGERDDSRMKRGSNRKVRRWTALESHCVLPGSYTSTIPGGGYMRVAKDEKSRSIRLELLIGRSVYHLHHHHQRRLRW